MGIKLLPPSEKINNSRNFFAILKNNISFQSLNTGNHDMVDLFWETNIFFNKKLYFILIDSLKRDIIYQNWLRFERVINFFARWQ